MPSTPRQKRQLARERIRDEIRRLKATGLTYEEIAPKLKRFGVDLNGKAAVRYYILSLENVAACCPACLREYEKV